ncbi:MAG: hypothetical protein WCS52_07780 [bacterium]
MIELTKTNRKTAEWVPFESGTVQLNVGTATGYQLVIEDAARREYVRCAIRPGQRVRFKARGTAGLHSVRVLSPLSSVLVETAFTLKAATRIHCDQGPYGKLMERLATLLATNDEARHWVLRGKLRHMLVIWGRDHVHTLKGMKYFMEDVKSAMDYWMETQEPNGMVWDNVYQNTNYPGRTWFGEALGKEYFRYEDGGRYIVRRIPVEADCEFLYTEGVWQAWKASGDDAWMAQQIPRLEKALKYNTTHPVRWSRKAGLVHRSMCMDSWDFTNPVFYKGDHRCVKPGDPQFLFHGDNSGVYSSYWRLADMIEHLGDSKRAGALRKEGEALRQRANKALFFGNTYGHMIPETLDPKAVYAKVGDERKRMSLSLGYTINRGLPTHAMAVKIIDEYQRRRQQERNNSFAEWWTMDPPYQLDQWPAEGSGASIWGDYMNGSICPIIAGELSRAAFEHGREAYGVDILERVWALSERDGGAMHQSYRRLPALPKLPKTRFTAISLAGVANRGLKDGASAAVPAWVNENENDMRNLPTGRRRYGAIEFTVGDPRRNEGRAVLHIDSGRADVPREATVPVKKIKARSLYFMQATSRALPPHAVVGLYDVRYADGTEMRLWIRNQHEISHWWGISDKGLDREIVRVAWRGKNPSWSNVGLMMFGWNNPHPDKPIVGIRVATADGGQETGMVLAAISASDQPVAFEPRIRSYGLPDSWSQAAVLYALTDGLAGVEDTGRAFSQARIAPRWSATPAKKAEVVLQYPASGGYCAYQYRYEPAKRRILLDVTGSMEQTQVNCLLPAGARVAEVAVGGQPVAFKIHTVETSNYVQFEASGLLREPVVIGLLK